jgi:U3 small nucleolar RNA-associated protein 15
MTFDLWNNCSCAVQVVAAVVEELANRGGLGAALGNCDEDMLLPVLSHVWKYLVQPRHTQVLAALCHRLLDAGAIRSCVTGKSGAVHQLDQLAMQLRERIQVELKLQDELVSLQGMLEAMLMAPAM